MALSPFDTLKRTFENLMKSRAHVRRGNELLAETAQRMQPHLVANTKLEKATLLAREAIELETEVIEALALRWAKGETDAKKTDC